MKVYKIASFGLMFCGAVLFSHCNSNQKPQVGTDKIPVKVATVQREMRAQPVIASGKLAPASEMKLSFKIGGIIGRLYAEAGNRVEKEQLLAKLEPSEINARLTRAEAACRKARRDFERVQNLYKDSVATLEQKQNAETALHAAEADLKIARFNRRHSEIHAPADGVILHRLVEANEMIESGMPVYIFGATRAPWKVKVGVTDREILRLQEGDSARITFDAYPEKEFPAAVSVLAQAPDPRTGTYQAELRIPPQENKLVAGFVARAEIRPSRKTAYLMIPVEALAEADGDSATVFALSPDRQSAGRKRIKIGPVFGDKVGVISGIPDSALLVTEGVEYLSDGAGVKVTSD